ncbi:galacturonic acid kinase isoform X2 [Wolffia australiana]
MANLSWPSAEEQARVREIASAMTGKNENDVKVVVSPYRICPLGAHIDHQGGTVLAMTINRGILLGFIPSNDSQSHLRSGQFDGEVKFSVDEAQQPKTTRMINLENGNNVHEEANWGDYAKGAVFALQKSGKQVTKGITGFICGSEGLDSSGLSSSAAVGIAYLLALEYANTLTLTPVENIELDRIIENEYLGLRNGILDQSAILLSNYGCLTSMNCKTKDYTLVPHPGINKNEKHENGEAFKILLAFSGLKHALTSTNGYNDRVAECQEAARVLLQATGSGDLEPLLCNVDRETYEAHKGKLKPSLAKRAEHFFSENARVTEGLKAWASGDLREFGTLMSASAQSSIQNYECGSEPLKDLCEALWQAPGVYGARFSGAGFRGCCVGLVEAGQAATAARLVELEYRRRQPELAAGLRPGSSVVLLCNPGQSAHLI